MISKKIVESIEQKKYEDNIANSCCLCGVDKAFKFEKRNKILSQSFTDFNFMKNRDSQFVCGYCEKLLSDNYMESPKGKRCGIRLYSFLVEKNKFKIIDKKEKEDYLFDYQFQIPYILCLSDSGQKHISWKAKEGNSNDTLIINTENEVLYFNRKKYKEVYLLVKKLYNNKISKEELLNCNLDPKKIKRLIDNSISSFNEIFYIKKFKDDNCYNFIINCLYKTKEEKKDD
jgi:CRISPR type IV-associated protein Csf1